MRSALASPLLVFSLAGSLAGCLTISLAGCSQQNWYHGARSAQTAYCMKQPPSEYKDCDKQSREMTYDEYKKNREELKLRKDSNGD